MSRNHICETDSTSTLYAWSDSSGGLELMVILDQATTKGCRGLADPCYNIVMIVAVCTSDVSESKITLSAFNCSVAHALVM